MKSLFDCAPFAEGFPLILDSSCGPVVPAAEAPEGMQLFTPQQPKRFASGREAVSYRTRDGRPLRMYVTAPYVEGDAENVPPRLPLVMFIQGSGYHRQNMMKNVPFIPGFAGRGFVVALVELTPSEERPFPADIEDLKAAIRAAKENADTLRIDPDKIFLWGDSSGAGRAVMAAVTGDGVCDEPGPHSCSCSVAGVVDFYGPTDFWDLANMEGLLLDHRSSESVCGWLIGKKPVLDNRSLAEAASPINYIQKDKALPPFLILHGDMDWVVPFRQSVLLYEKLKETGHEAALYKVPGAGHSTPEFWSEETADLVEAFMRAQL